MADKPTAAADYSELQMTDAYSPTCVFLADDHFVSRKGTAALLESNGFRIVGEAENLRDTLTTAPSLHPHIVLLDLTMGDSMELNEFSTIQQLSSGSDKPQVVVFSMRESIPAVRQAYQAGARGYVTKRSGPDVLLEALRTVRRGDKYFMPGMMEEIAQSVGEPQMERDPRNVLSEVELKTFLLLALGHSHEDVAAEQGIHLRTVTNRTVSIRTKLGCKTKDFLRIALSFNLIDPARS